MEPYLCSIRKGDKLRNCWCGSNAPLSPFNEVYAVCKSCQTLISQNQLTNDNYLVKDDNVDFYGKQYWLSHQNQDLGFADIYSRTRSDLSERNLHWLKILLKYKCPPAKILELGCSHGSFVALMQQAGYDAVGVELSPWVVDFAKKTFDVPISLGPLENIKFSQNSFDIIVMMDVLEHLPDPLATIGHCMELLKPDGFLLVQTPQFREEMRHKNLLAKKSLFLDVLIEDEHLFLFSESSVTRFFRHLGATHIEFEPAIFAHYDMFFVASRERLKCNSPEQIESTLLANPKSRFTLALLDLRERELQISRLLNDSEADRSERGKQIETLSMLLQETETDRVARGKQIETLSMLLQKAGTGWAVRRRLINKLSLILKKLESNKKECLSQIAALKSSWDSLFSRPLFRLLTKGVHWPKARNYKETTMNDSLKTIVVDLTPILPGGENGGAKIFVLDLLSRLAELAPETQFVLLTQAASHEELRHLECKNVKCTQVVSSSVKQSFWYRLLSYTLRKLPPLPRRLTYLGYRFNASLKRRGARSLLHKIGADLLFCPFTAPTFYEPGIPTVCTLYDLQYKTYPEFFTAEEVAHREHTFVEACRRASMLTAISDYSRQSAIRHGGLKPEKIQTIHLQMAHRILPDRAQDESILQRLGLVAQQYLLYPANFWKHKNHEMLLTAFGIACQDELAKNIKLVCTGTPGTRQTWLATAAQKMNLGERVIFPGYLTNNELAVLMANCGGIVYPSLYEGFGLPIIEAMAAGIPVACSNLTSLPEVAGKAAILFNPRVPTQIAKAMNSLLGDQELRQELINAGKSRAAEFSDADRMAKQYWALFKLALSEKKQEDGLSGVYEDGWLGSLMNIQVAPSPSEQALEMTFFVPDWLPQSKITVKTLRAGKNEGEPLEIPRGKSATLSLPLPSAGGHYELRMTPTFVPSQAGHNTNDQRELSLMIQSCRVLRDKGESVELFSEKKSA